MKEYSGRNGFAVESFPTNLSESSKCCIVKALCIPLKGEQQLSGHRLDAQNSWTAS